MRRLSEKERALIGVRPPATAKALGKAGFHNGFQSGIFFAQGRNVSCRLCAVMVYAVALLRAEAAPTTLTEFPFEFREGLLWVEVNVPQSKKPLNFLVDTGAGVSVINLSTAKRIGLKLGREVRFTASKPCSPATGSNECSRRSARWNCRGSIWPSIWTS